MLRSTFENSWRHPITGELFGIHSGVQNWLSKLGLKDDQGIALADPEFFNRYGPQGVKDNPQVTLVSNTGHHGQDQAALYLAQQGIQNGKTWFPEMGEVMPPEYAQQAHGDLRDQIEGKKKTAMAEQSGDPQLDGLIEQFKAGQYDRDGEMRDVSGLNDPEAAFSFCDVLAQHFTEFLQQRGIEAHRSDDPNKGIGAPLTPDTQWLFKDRTRDIPGPKEHGYSDRSVGGIGEHAAVIVPMQSGTYMVDWTAAQYGYTEFPMVQKLDEGGWQREWHAKMADLRDPVTEPSWMATDADIQEMNLCPKCGKPDCIHMVNQSPQGMQIHPKWQDNSSPLDSHGA